MRLEDVTVAIRPRNPWEAMDLGFSLVRQRWKAIYLPWFAVVLPIFAIVNLALAEHLWLAGLIIWWLKPLYDRIVLHVLSHAVFGNAPTVQETLEALPRLLKTGLLAQLTFLRLDVARAFNLPVWQLEGLRGRARRERQRVLGQRTHGHATWLLLTCINLEMVISLSLIGLVFLLLPTSVDKGFLLAMFTQDGDRITQIASNGAYLLSLSLIEPLYLAAGFALYINRRTVLEAWDIELVFRRMTARLSRHTAAVAIVLALLICLPGALLTPRVSLAQERLPASQSKQIIEQVLEAEEFQTTEEVETWLPKKKDVPQRDTAEEIEWLSALMDVIATIAEALLWILLGVGVLILYIYRARWLGLFAAGGRKRAAYKPPDVLFGLDIRPESLPADIPGEALKLWQAGEHRQAISLLYRGSLMVLTSREHVRLQSSHTEGDVLRIASEQLDAATAQYQSRLTQCWQAIAYAHRTPAAQTAETLCTDWPRHFGEHSS